jgi:hypothetical protein
MLRKLSWPAVSQICSLICLSSMLTMRLPNSTPIGQVVHVLEALVRELQKQARLAHAWGARRTSTGARRQISSI